MPLSSSASWECCHTADLSGSTAWKQKPNNKTTFQIKKNKKNPNYHCINANGSYLKKAPDYPFQAIIHWWTKGPGLMMFVCSWWGWWGWWCAPQLRVLKYSAKKKQRDSNYSPDIIKTFTSRHWSISWCTSSWAWRECFPEPCSPSCGLRDSAGGDNCRPVLTTPAAVETHLDKYVEKRAEESVWGYNANWPPSRKQSVPTCYNSMWATWQGPLAWQASLA